LVLDTLDELQEDTCDGSFQVKRTWDWTIPHTRCLKAY
jgi:hypothetical protein